MFSNVLSYLILNILLLRSLNKCLYLSAFHPVFTIVDESTGNTLRFTGKYHLTIIGGGEDVYSIEEYSASDVALFNYQTHG